MPSEEDNRASRFFPLASYSRRSMPAQRHKILNIARNESFLKSRSAALEAAGYEVVSALNILTVERECETHGSFDLVIIGHSLPKGEKRRVMLAVRQFCGRIPILELYPPGTTPVDEEADEELPSPDEPDALLAKVGEMLARKRKKGSAAS
jgi:DNA-binding response OmpR family regulator